jgi:hypothetical protein
VVAVTDLEGGIKDIDAEELRRRENSQPSPSTPREFRCPNCNSRCTRLTDGHSEAGHRWDCERRLRRVGGGSRTAPSLQPGLDDATPGVEPRKEVSQ